MKELREHFAVLILMGMEKLQRTSLSEDVLAMNTSLPLWKGLGFSSTIGKIDYTDDLNI